MKLEVGKLYLTRDGKRVKIIDNEEGGSIWPFYGDNKYTYRSDGNVSNRYESNDEPHNPCFDLDNDLIKELTPEEYPEYFI